ncbi:MAG: zinc metallopeptidase [Candidatus Omnitrophica bacterium]|nr:zinc metallopeptidase [Candidatus Omnitrophota bacterium]
MDILTYGVVLLFPIIVLVLYVEYHVLTTFYRYRGPFLRLTMRGCEMARRILDLNGLGDISVESAEGRPRSRYNSKRNVLELTAGLYEGTSQAAIAEAAYEAQWVGEMVQNPILAFATRFLSFSSFAVMPFAFLFMLIGMTFTVLAFVFGLGLFILIGYITIAGFILPSRFKAVYNAVRSLVKSQELNEPEIAPLRIIMQSVALMDISGAVDWVRFGISKLMRRES